MKYIQPRLSFEMLGMLILLAVLYAGQTDAVLGVPVNELSRNQKFELEKLFVSMDTDRNGVVDVAELTPVMPSVVNIPGEPTLNDFLREADTSGNGEIDRTEFMTAMARRLKHTGEEDSWQEFDKFDEDGNGFITKEEIKRVALDHGTRLTDEQVDDDIFGPADKDGDQLLDIDEFTDMMMDR